MNEIDRLAALADQGVTIVRIEGAHQRSDACTPGTCEIEHVRRPSA